MTLAHFDTSGEVLLVTGGASGIGEAIAAAFADAGGSAVVLDVQRSSRLEAHERVVQLDVDVSDRDAVRAAVAQTVATHGRIDALVASAAVQPRTPVADMDPEEWRRTLAVNLHGAVWACQAVLPTMIDHRRGSIVVFASGLARAGRAEASAYAASKGAVVAFARCLAAEVSQHGIRVNVLSPGVIDTPQFRAANPPGPERDHWARATGIGRPQDVVGPLLYLLSDATTMTGSTIYRERGYPRSGDDDNG